MEYQPPPFFNRGPSAFTRFLVCLVLSFALLITDARYHYLNAVREAVSVALYPLLRLATAPYGALMRGAEFFVTQSSLIAENGRLKTQAFDQGRRLQRLEALEIENERLRKLLDAAERIEGRAIFAEVLYARRDPFTRRILVDKGTQHGVKAGQAVVDEAGVVGQVTRVHPFVSDVTLITDKDQPVPVKVLRSGLRAVVFGAGRDDELELRYLPVNADVRNGDVLVTSGIDGTYPPGVPVAVVSKIERDAALPFARIKGSPSAGVARHSQVLVVSNTREFPQPPPEAEPSGPGRLRAERGKN
jgi:rod shape-determining protein MreC